MAAGGELVPNPHFGPACMNHGLLMLQQIIAMAQDITSITAGMPEEVKRDLNSSSYFLERAE
eukprot:498646-Pelagomonas_calceolata.AAC.2